AVVDGRLRKLEAWSPEDLPPPHVPKGARGEQPETALPWIASLVGDEHGDPELAKVDDALRVAITIQRAARESPEAAWKQCAAASPAALGNVADEVLIVLAA